MKTQIIISIMAIVAFVSSCNKVDISPSLATRKSQIGPKANQPVALDSLFIKASENDSDWNSPQTQAYHQGLDTVVITGYGKMDKELLNLRLKFQGTGHYILTGNQGSLLLLYGEAIITGKFHLDANSESSVDITSYDPDTKIAKGTFNLKLVNNFSTDTRNPQNINFTNGSFRVQIQ